MRNKAKIHFVKLFIILDLTKKCVRTRNVPICRIGVLGPQPISRLGFLGVLGLTHWELGTGQSKWSGEH